MKLLVAAAVTAGLLTAGAANANTVFFEGFDGYSPATIAHGATGGTSGNPFTPAATSTTGNSISTDYAYRVPNGQNHSNQADSMYGEGTWTIGTNPFAVHDLWVNTPNNVDPFLILNGAPIAQNSPPPTAYESGGILVGAGVYHYSYDLLNVCCNANGPTGVPSILQFWYTAPDGAQQILIGTPNATVSAANGWEVISGSFTVAQPGGVIRLGLVDNNAEFSGNDFGVDNITLTDGVPEPASWALMIMGFGAAGSMLRRRRALVA